MNRDEQHGMPGWGKRIADFDEPRTMPEAAFTAQMMAADRLLEVVTLLQTLEARLSRIESWMEMTLPGYQQSPAYQKTPGNHPSADGQRPVAFRPALRGVRVT